MKKSEVVALGLTKILLSVIYVIIIKLLWGWTIPEIFPGAVAQGLIEAHISWVTAYKIAFFIAVVT